MGDRCSAHRLARVQKQLHRMTQFRLMLMKAQQDELASMDKTLVAAFGDSLAGAPQVAGMLQNALRRVARESQEAEASAREASRALIEHGGRLKCAEALADRRTAEWRAEMERRTLREILESVVARRSASFR